MILKIQLTGTRIPYDTKIKFTVYPDWENSNDNTMIDVRACHPFCSEPFESCYPSVFLYFNNEYCVISNVRDSIANIIQSNFSLNCSNVSVDTIYVSASSKGHFVLDPIVVALLAPYLTMSIEYTMLELTNVPSILSPVYNPVVYQFTSNEVTQPGYRFVTQVKDNRSDELLGTFRTIPEINGTGHIDISKILSNKCSVDAWLDYLDEDFHQNIQNSGFNYKLILQEEWIYNLRYSDAESNNGILLINGPSSNEFIVGDKVNIIVMNWNSHTPFAGLEGIHKITNIGSTTITVDNPVGLTSSQLSGIVTQVRYADNRKVINRQFSITVDNKWCMNGVRSWIGQYGFNEWSGKSWILDSAGNTQRWLTDFPREGMHITPEQDIWLNYIIFTSKENVSLSLKIIVDVPGEGEVSYYSPLTVTGPNNGISQIKVDLNSDALAILNNKSEVLNLLSTSDLLRSGIIPSYTIVMVNSNADNIDISEPITFSIDTRCQISDIQIAFMDRMGSILSYAFQLIPTEKGTVKREDFKQYFPIAQLNGQPEYSNYIGGQTNTSIVVDKTWILNTNWMTEQESIFFQQLVTSPYTWIKLDGGYYNCIVTDKDFEVTTNRNKKLIRKTISVKLSKQDKINI